MDLEDKNKALLALAVGLNITINRLSTLLGKDRDTEVSVSLFNQPLKRAGQLSLVFFRSL